MTRSPIRSPNPSSFRTGAELTRRRLIAAAVAGGAALAMPGGAQALSTGDAQALVSRVVDEINRIIATGKTGTAIYRDFENIFERYADVRVIAGSVLGPAARSLSSSQERAFIDAFQGYVSRKYGRRFTEFKGGTVEVSRATPVSNYVEVRGVARLPGQSPFEVSFLVSDRAGSARFFDILIEGVSLRLTERGEIGAMLDQRRGDVDRLIADLRTL